MAKGFQEEDKVQLDSPMAQRESFQMFILTAFNIQMEMLCLIKITTAFLQWDVFLKIMADILGSHNLWKLKKLLYGFIDAGKHFWLNVKEILEDKTFEMLQGDASFYLKNYNGELISMIL